jgi:hypothetical protein
MSVKNWVVNNVLWRKRWGGTDNRMGKIFAGYFVLMPHMANRPVSVRGWYDLQPLEQVRKICSPYLMRVSPQCEKKKKEKPFTFAKGVYGTMDLTAIKFIGFKLIMSS